MAEGDDKMSSDSETLKTTVNSPPSGHECSICLQPCVHPAQLPCSHVFCFLCIKGIAFQSGRCAMCRQPIPVEYLYKPKLLSPLKLDDVNDTYQWYYEGGSGWWQYDPRASAEIEESYQQGEKACNLLLAGFLYVIDFTNMLQYRQTNPVRRRKIKRDRSTTDRLGVAGLSNNAFQQQIDEVELGFQNLRTCESASASSSRSVQPGAESVTSPRFSRHDSENYGLESLGPEYSENLSFQAVSPSQRDGRCFNPRLDLGESGDEDSDLDLAEEDDEEDVPRRIVGGPWLHSENQGGVTPIAQQNAPFLNAEGEYVPRRIMGGQSVEEEDVPRRIMEGQSEEEEDVPRRIMGGPFHLPSATFRPLPVRAPGADALSSDLDTDIQ